MGKKTSRAKDGVGAALLERTYVAVRPLRMSDRIVQDAQNHFCEYADLASALNSVSEAWEIIDVLKGARESCAGCISREDQRLAVKLANFMIKYKIT